MFLTHHGVHVLISLQLCRFSSGHVLFISRKLFDRNFLLTFTAMYSHKKKQVILSSSQGLRNAFCVIVSNRYITRSLSNVHLDLKWPVVQATFPDWHRTNRPPAPSRRLPTLSNSGTTSKENLLWSLGRRSQQDFCFPAGIWLTISW